MSEELSKDMQELVSFEDYHFKFHDTTGIDIVLEILNKHIDDFTISEEQRAELLAGIEMASDLRVLPAVIADMLSKEGAEKLTAINTETRKKLNLPSIDSLSVPELQEENIEARVSGTNKDGYQEDRMIDINNGVYTQREFDAMIAATNPETMVQEDAELEAIKAADPLYPKVMAKYEEDYKKQIVDLVNTDNRIDDTMATEIDGSIAANSGRHM